MSQKPLLYVSVRPQRGAAVAEYGSFRNGSGLDETQLHWHDLVAAPLPSNVFENYRGFFIGGSPYNLSDHASDKSTTQLRVESELRLIAETVLDQTNLRALFTCFGIGIVTELLGGKIVRDHGEAASATTITTTDSAETDPLFNTLQPRFDALVAHKEAAAATPPGATLLAFNDSCPVQSYRVDQRLWATQFHPETTSEDFIARMHFYRDAGYFDAAEFDQTAASVAAAAVKDPTRMLREFALLASPLTV